jgi:hypothetical protein
MHQTFTIFVPNITVTSDSLIACATGMAKMTSNRYHPLLMPKVHLVKLIDSEHATNETERLFQISANQ